MPRSVAVALAFTLAALWLLGLHQRAAAWLTWANAAAALLAGLIPAVASPPGTVALAAMAIGQLGLWLGALAAGAERWLAWSDFAVGCLFLLAAVASETRLERPTSAPRS